jgi:hypothetical protein
MIDVRRRRICLWHDWILDTGYKKQEILICELRFKNTGYRIVIIYLSFVIFFASFAYCYFFLCVLNTFKVKEILWQN